MMTVTGEVIKESLKESLDKISSFQNIDLSYFTVFPGQNINKDIMELVTLKRENKH